MSRRLWLLAALSVVAMLTIGSGGYSSASMDRGVSVGVAGHQDAAVSLWDPGAHGDVPHEDPVTATDSRTTLFLVQNRFPDTAIDVTARVAEAPPGVRVTAIETASLPAGVPTREPIRGTVHCGGQHGPTRVLLDVTASGSGLRASISFPVTVVCATPPPSSGGPEA